MNRSSSVKALQETLPALQKEIEAAKRKAGRAQGKLDLLVEERDHILKLLELHGIKVPPSGGKQAAVPQTGDLELTGPHIPVKTPSFRDAVKSILLSATEPLRPPEVARRLAATDYQYDARTSLAQRIGNELIRMHKAGIVEKIDLAYRLPVDTGEGAS